MPLFFQQQLNNHTQLAIWKIEEAEPFFEVPLQRSITHPHKRLQHLAGRYLLKYLFPLFPLELIQIADTRKPFLESELFHFSIAHCGKYAAVVVSTQNRVGVDIEMIADKVQKVQHKFVSTAEMEIVKTASANQHGQLSTVNAQLILIWSCKEALFKWYGSGELDFKEHMQLQGIKIIDNKHFEIAMRLKKTGDKLLCLRSRFFDDLCLCYIVT